MKTKKLIAYRRRGNTMTFIAWRQNLLTGMGSEQYIVNLKEN